MKNLDKISTRESATEPKATTKPTEATETKTKCKISSSKLREEFLNEIKNAEKI